MEQGPKIEREKAWDANVEVERVENIEREIELLNPLTDENRELKERCLQGVLRAKSESNHGILMVLIEKIRESLSTYDETHSEQDREVKTRALNIIDGILEKNQ